MSTILVVTCDTAGASALAHLFESSGVVPLAVTNAKDALAVATCYQYEFAVIDIDLPGRDGIELCNALLGFAREKGQRTPLIWVYGVAPKPMERARAREAGAQGVLEKIADAEMFVREVVGTVLAAKSGVLAS